jgi:hypothetical protein
MPAYIVLICRLNIRNHNGLAEQRNALAAVRAELDAFAGFDCGIKRDDGLWRAGLALPLYPMQLPQARSVLHETRNALIFGWAHGSVLVAKRETKNVHWGTAVTDPAWRLIKRETRVALELTSRSANILRKLVTISHPR